MATTRIILKNLPPYLSQEAFTKHFQAHSSPTDARLQTSKSGKSRRFGFLGFAQPDAAANAVEYWNNTYIGSTKISAELARTVEEEQSSNYKRKRPVEDAVSTARLAQETKKRKTRGEEAEDPKFEEFLRVNQPRSKTKSFLNDDGDFAQQAAVADSDELLEDPPAVDDDSGYEDVPKKNEEYEVIEHEISQSGEPQEVDRVATAVPDDADDSEWLRNRTSRTLDLVEPEEEIARTLKTTPRDVTTLPAKRMVRSLQTGVQEPVPEPIVLSQDEIDKERIKEKGIAKEVAIDAVQSSSRLFLRNLAFTVDEAALQGLFSNYGTVEEVHIPQTKEGKCKGTAFVLFTKPAAAVQAFTELDGKQFQGRLLHILPGQNRLTIEKPQAPGQKPNIGEKRKEERRKEAAKSRFNWNSLFLNQNAVLETTAKKFGVDKSELLDPSQSSAAVTMALAESSALNTIKKYFILHGVNLQSFADVKQKDDSVLLFKNLPSNANEAEIRKLVEGAGGVVNRLVIPEIGGLAIVELGDANQGKMVFGKLAYRKFGDGLIYLEKGPVNTFTSAAPLTSSASKLNGQTDLDQDQSDGDEEAARQDRATIFVKNLNFDTRAPELTRIFESLKGFRSATVKTKPSPKDPSNNAARLSMGFGFVDFATEADAKAAISAMQGFTLDAHALELKLSNGRTTDAKATTRSGANGMNGQSGTKIVVKNLPFETTKSDIQKLFSTYGSLKSLRLPKKYNSHLRGFAFLEFVSKREAKNAITALTGTHLLGRRLVLEYAQTEATGDEGIEQLVEKTRLKRSAVESVEKGRRKAGKINLDGTEADGLE